MLGFPLVQWQECELNDLFWGGVMDLPEGLISTPWLWAANLLFFPVLAVALYRAPWWRLRSREGQHLLLGACVFTFFLWNVKAGVSPGLTFHLLGAGLLTLMFSWEFALIIMAVALAGNTWIGGMGWESFALNGLIMTALPVLIIYRIFLQVDRHAPNFFVYVLACSFLGGAFSVLMAGMTGAVVLWGSGVYTFDYLSDSYLPFLPLIMVPEGAFNGMLTTLLITYRPEWVRTFRDERYINGK